jgi:transcriptional regulator with XRE-family HTH domain
MKLSSQKKPNHLRMTLVRRGLTANDLAGGAGISISLALKLMSDHLAPSAKTTQKVERWLGQRVWSSPTGYRAAQRSLELEHLVAQVIQSDGVTRERATEMTLAKFPFLAVPTATLSPQPPITIST